MTVIILAGIALALAVAAIIVTTVILLQGRPYRGRRGGAS
jgi:hypothetical protein